MNRPYSPIEGIALVAAVLASAFPRFLALWEGELCALKTSLAAL